MAEEKAHATSLVTAGVGHRNKWFVENITEDLLHVSSIRTVEFTGMSRFQEVDVIQLGSFGRTLVLDNKLQSAEVDEFAYHESLVHPAMLAHPCPKRVLIGGGGEGATAREVLRHKTVEKCVMVDIDDLVVDMCKKHLPNHSQGAFDDPRFELVVEDVKKYLEVDAKDMKFDVIILDLSDPVDGNPCYFLYTKSWYEFLLTRLSPGGIVVTQAGPAGILSCKEVFTPVVNTFAKVFAHSCAYTAHIPSFLNIYGFAIGSNDADPSGLSPEEVDRLAEERITGEMKFMDGIGHRGAFLLCLPLRKMIAEETHVITEDALVFIPQEVG